MKELTKAEEQIMQYVWKLEKAYLKDIVAQFPEPKPAYTTISTVIRVLTKKGFLGFNTYGKVNEYYPLVSKKEYFGSHFKGIVKSFFNGSLSGFASFFTESEDLSISELEEIKRMVEDKIDQKKKTK
ncbi:BlaI/MecI/CopY family transcriptional regulator [Sediminitomix flava]|uniref:Putative transcriptional regulator n=1 Tax=Sediminitomix flava TaxID=379075 RepID=A0A315Z7U0_SEDFL|nr:BlaI/MecI/CopY family transcriptional regulator [Sediminitomix flava]PWJ40111.1 putative transcriptional regulator [Sediminitomix flava]